MKTVSSSENLIVWKRNSNGSNIELTTLDGDALFLKKYYAETFRKCAETLKKGRTASFVDMWQDVMDDECKAVKAALTAQIAKHGLVVEESQIERVVSKFRGNCGEILVEKLALKGRLSSVCEDYSPVDPDNEQFVDATGTMNGLPVGIQVKNYSKHVNVSSETFVKAAAQTALWLQRDSLVADESLKDFKASPAQYVVSMTVADLMLEDRFAGCVVFLGPKWFRSLRLEGSLKTKMPPAWGMFQEIASEIEKLV